MVQALPSSQIGVVVVMCLQPSAGSQVSGVQKTPSSQAESFGLVDAAGRLTGVDGALHAVVAVGVGSDRAGPVDEEAMLLDEATLLELEDEAIDDELPPTTTSPTTRPTSFLDAVAPPAPPCPWSAPTSSSERAPQEAAAASAPEARATPASVRPKRKPSIARG